MSVLYVVLPVSLLLAAAAVGLFVWAARNGQLDDLTTPAMRVLCDDDDDDAPGPEDPEGPDRPEAPPG